MVVPLPAGSTKQLEVPRKREVEAMAGPDDVHSSILRRRDLEPTLPVVRFNHEHD